MTTINWERYARATGIGFVVLFVVGFIIYGEQPGIGSGAEEITAFYDGDRSRVLTASFIFGIAILMLLWFAGAIANALREAGEGRLAATTIASAATLGGFFFVISAINTSLAYSIAGAGDTGVVQALNELSWACGVIASYPAAGLILAATIGLWRTALIPYWFGWAGVIAGIVVLLGATTWADDGIWAPDGAYTFVTIIAAMGWIAVASGILYMRAPAVERTPERAATIPAP